MGGPWFFGETRQSGNRLDLFGLITGQLLGPDQFGQGR